MTRLERAAPLLALIRKHESDSVVKAQGVPSAYDVVYSGIPAYRRPLAHLTTYPVAEVIEWQEFVVAKGAASSAAGAYQIIRKTLAGLGLPSARIFDAACQDDAAMILLDRRGWKRCEGGDISPEAFGNELAKEWASLPVITGAKRGQSYYAGDGLNKAHATPEEVLAAIRAALKPEAAPAPAQGPSEAWLAEGRKLHAALGDWLARAE